MHLGNCSPNNYPLSPRQSPPHNSHQEKLPPDNWTWTISSKDNWSPGQMCPGHLPPILIRVNASRWLCCLRIFIFFHPAFVTIKYFTNIIMHFVQIYDRFPFRITSEVFELLCKGFWLFKFETFLLLHSFWHKFTSTKSQNEEEFSRSE